MMRALALRFWGVVLALLLGSSAFAQTTLYTTLPANPSGGPCFGNGNLAAVEIATPAGSTYQIGSAQVAMHHAGDGTASFTVTVYSDNAGTPGTAVATIGTAAGHGVGTQDVYSLTPATPISLSPSTNYWIVASSTSTDSCAFGWTYPASAPSGVFSYVAEAQYFSGSWQNRTGQHFALELLGPGAAAAAVAVAVPTLSEWALLLLAALLGMMAIRQTWRRSR
ncbi:MAG: IPTL-CTERM sorting domain-containing protein [Burkholderiaceae bacterium]